jgi:cell division protein FtsB
LTANTSQGRFHYADSPTAASGQPCRIFIGGLWFGNGGAFALKELRHELAQQRQENQRLRERNLALGAEVLDLKLGLEAVEERARAELGMVRRGETFYQLVEPKANL